MLIELLLVEEVFLGLNCSVKKLKQMTETLIWIVNVIILFLYNFFALMAEIMDIFIGGLILNR